LLTICRFFENRGLRLSSSLFSKNLRDQLQRNPDAQSGFSRSRLGRDVRYALHGCSRQVPRARCAAWHDSDLFQNCAILNRHPIGTACKLLRYEEAMWRCEGAIAASPQPGSFCSSGGAAAVESAPLLFCWFATHKFRRAPLNPTLSIDNAIRRMFSTVTGIPEFPALHRRRDLNNPNFQA
jgi:hypothetical protein